MFHAKMLQMLHRICAFVAVEQSWLWCCQVVCTQIHVHFTSLASNSA